MQGRDKFGRFVKGYKSHLGKKFSKEWRANLSESHKGNPGYWTGKKRPEVINFKGFIEKGRKPWHAGTHIQLNTGRTHFKKGLKWSKEQIRKCLHRRKKSSLEIKFNEIIQKYNLPYKFVGNGAFFIERKNPDFVNCNGQKIAVEVFCRKHKDLFRGDYKQWMKDRQETFDKYGWKIEFFNECQVNENEVLDRLQGES